MSTPSIATHTTGPKDIFLQLLTMIALYLSAVHVGVVLFQLVNVTIPDPLAGTDAWMMESVRGALRWALATLVIVFPVYLWATWSTERALVRIPEKRGMRTRRWLLHLTVFTAAVIIIGSLVRIVYSYLTGELSVRFAMKVLAVLTIAATVFTYEFLVIRRDDGKPAPSWMPWFTRGAIACAIAALIAGFITIGTPAQQRLRRFDDRRVSDLQNIQGRVVEDWRVKDALPENLDELRDSISGYVPPVDPQTERPYEYRVTGSLSFELCATFRTAATSTGFERYPMPYDMGGGWMHGEGRVCFARTIDRDRYRTVAPIPEKLPIPAP